MDGFQVMPIADAATRGDIFVTTTGNLNVISRAHFPILKNGAILANAGHFNDEIEIGELEKLATSTREIRPFVREYQLRVPPGGSGVPPGESKARKIYLLADGRLVNHAAAEANPAAVMDMSFSNQVLAIEYLLEHRKELEPRVYPVPRELDAQIARSKLAAMGMRIDTMTEEQRIYANSWKAGT